MLLEEAKRFCKQLLQKPKTDKGGDSNLSQSQLSSMSGVETRLVKGPPDIQDVPTITAQIQKPKLISLENIMKSQTLNTSLLKGTQSLFPSVPNSSAEQGQSEVKNTSGGVETNDVIVLSDSSTDIPSKSKTDATNSQMSVSQSETADSVSRSEFSSPAQPSGANAPTVKIKMGLLQAVKKLKPNIQDSKQNTPNQGGDTDMSMDEGVSSAVSEDESESVLRSATDAAEDFSDSSSESSSSESSSSKSGKSSSSSDDDDENDESGDDSGDEGDDNEDDDDDKDDDDENETSDAGEKSDRNENKAVTTPKLKAKAPPSSEEEESSDNADEIDLVSSEDEKDDDKDKDYNASEDDDVIMISDDEFKPKGRAVIPSPVREKEEGMEILVKDVPDFNPNIFSIMSDALDPGKK